MNAYIQEVLEKVESATRTSLNSFRPLKRSSSPLRPLSISIPNTRRPVCLSALLSPSV